MEWGVGLLLSLAILGLHVIAARFGGGLWRDEANTVGLATLPSLGDVWQNLQYDSFPLLWLLIVRAFCAVFGAMNDPAFRALGFLIGSGVVGALWFNARTFGHSVPLLSLALVAISPSLIRWGDSLRGYGLGIVLILVTSALLWRFLEQPGTARLVLTAVAAIASVQILFYNSALLLACCAGGVAVCARRRAWKTAVSVVMIGALAAVSMLPYARTIRAASSWNMLVQIPDYTFGWFWAKLAMTLGAGGVSAIVGWTEATCLALIFGAWAVRSRVKFGLSQREQEVVLYSLVTLVVAIVAVFIFLNQLSYPTEPWYYLALIALGGACLDAIFGALLRGPAARIGRLVGVLVIAGLTVVPAARAAATRLTNVDVVADRLRMIATAHDVVLVSFWPDGVSFNRYYRGAAPWVTVPPLGFHKFHRYDLVKDKMSMTDQKSPVLPATDQAGEALRTGHRVFIVDHSVFLSHGRAARLLRPAPLAGGRWPEPEYSIQWSAMVRDFVRLHARTLELVPLQTSGRVSAYEDLILIVAQGWHQ